MRGLASRGGRRLDGEMADRIFQVRHLSGLYFFRRPITEVIIGYYPSSEYSATQPSSSSNTAVDDAAGPQVLPKYGRTGEVPFEEYLGALFSSIYISA